MAVLPIHTTGCVAPSDTHLKRPVSLCMCTVQRAWLMYSHRYQARNMAKHIQSTFGDFLGRKRTKRETRENGGGVLGWVGSRQVRTAGFMPELASGSACRRPRWEEEENPVEWTLSVTRTTIFSSARILQNRSSGEAHRSRFHCSYAAEGFGVFSKKKSIPLGTSLPHIQSKLGVN